MKLIKGHVYAINSKNKDIGIFYGVYNGLDEDYSVFDYLCSPSKKWPLKIFKWESAGLSKDNCTDLGKCNPKKFKENHPELFL